jgi:antitoxin FitA
MSMLKVRGIDPEVKEKLRRRAARHGRSMEAEARLILASVVATEDEPVDLVASIREFFASRQSVRLLGRLLLARWTEQISVHHPAARSAYRGALRLDLVDDFTQPT